jgi:hypothetical protein
MIIACCDILVERRFPKLRDFNRGSRSAIIFIMWSVKYCLLVFIAVLGVLQLAAVHNNFRGLFFFPRKIPNVIFTVLTIGFSLFTFFRWYVPSGIVVEGGQQTGSFVISAGAGILFTLVFSSIINNKRLGGDNPGRDGLETLRESTFFHAIRRFRERKE